MTSSDSAFITEPPRGRLARIATRSAAWSEKWFPNTLVFALLTVAVVAVAAMGIGSSPAKVATVFGDGFWDLIPFTMQMAMVAIGGYVVATSGPVRKAITRLARVPGNPRAAIAMVAAVSLLSALLNWGFSLIFSALLVRRLAERHELRMDYRAASAAAYLGLGGSWALGLSSSAAQLQANPASIPKSLLPVTGVIPFRETIFTWQSLLLAAVVVVVCVIVAFLTAPRASAARTAADLGIDPRDPVEDDTPRSRPGEWLEYSPLLTIVVVALVGGWAVQEFADNDPIVAISGLNTYNLLFLTLGLLLHWRPRRFLSAVTKAVPATGGVLIQFPFYAGIAAIMTKATDSAGTSISHHLAALFTSAGNDTTFPLLIGVYSVVLGFVIPSGGGKWIIEAPYVMQAANDAHVNLGWTVQVYNASEALPNLINPFWMLPLLGVLSLKARDIVGYTFVYLVVLFPIVLGLLTLLSATLPYHPPILP
ncbi:short-chain fatty acid transporter [Amycolatopsis sp. BJA-103]|uniref:short-chain fatty acid transporter n=1 Tax=unclassified Amycolatopsis TaxID=2618356 RepID=UPI000C795098|nr:TIGR00366 family protein [Amycolatopsis sp. BJA-103]AUI61182.1 Short chain fatty acid transporter [Amycolatopsis sp. BJA-103]PNE21529.1 Short chain fatty acid transporter [Amycolatopsis sp. BJA-103]